MPPSRRPSPIHAAALDLAMGGLPVIPCNPKNKAPLTAHGKDDGSTDLDQIDAWWRQWPSALVAVAAPANVVILDLDVPGAAHKKLAADGVATFQRLAGHDPRAAPTVVAETGGGGIHVWYTLPDDLANLPPLKLGGKPGWGNRESCFKDIAARDGATGINIRGTGKGYVIAPPSIHPDTGRPYRWLTTPPSDMRPAPAPDWLTSRMRAVVAEEARTRAEAQARAEAVARRPPTPGRPSPVARAMAHLERVEPAIQGSGGHAHTLRTTARVVCGYALTTDQAMDAFAAWNAQCSPPWSERDLREMIDGATKLQQGRGDLLNEDRPRPAAGRPRHGGGDEPPQWACEDIPDLEFEGPAARDPVPAAPAAQPKNGTTKPQKQPRPEPRPAPELPADHAPRPPPPDDDLDAWDDPDADYAPPSDSEFPPETAYRIASSGQAYVLTRGEWHPYHRDPLWTWCYRQNADMDPRDRGKAATLQARTLPVAFSLDMHTTTTNPVVLVNGLPHLNTFRGVMMPAAPGTPPDFPTIAEHLNFMFGVDTIEQGWMLDWLAKWYTPLATGRGFFRTQCMPLLYGTTGTGKGLLIKLLRRVIGAGHLVKVKGTSLDEKFAPAALERALLYVIDELNDPAKMDALKTYITEDDPSKRDMQKQEATFTPKFNMLATSNLIRPMQIASDDRRVTVIRLREHMPKDLAQRIVDHERAGYPELPAFLRFLADRDVVHGEPMEPLDNDDRAALVTLSKEPHIEFLEDVRDLGIASLVEDYGRAHPNLSLGVWRSKPDAFGNVACTLTLFAATYRHWCQVRGKKALDSSLVVSEAPTVIPTAVYIGQDKRRGWVARIAGKNERCIKGLPLIGTPDAPEIGDRPLASGSSSYPSTWS